MTNKTIQKRLNFVASPFPRNQSIHIAKPVNISKPNRSLYIKGPLQGILIILNN